jgi:histidinol dehydrogenase
MSVALRFTGAWAALAPTDRAALRERATASDREADGVVRDILDRVRREGDRALIALTRELDGIAEPVLEVPAAALRTALGTLDPVLRAALERAAHNIEAAHRVQRPAPTAIEVEPGVLVGRRPDPLARVGVYAPGGRAAYPSSVLMGVVPARVAGVGEVVVCSPPGADGRPLPVVLAAAAIAGADRVLALGGAQAIAALAYGTVTVPAVERIVGPGNVYVNSAKRLVAGEGRVGIDNPAGPSEVAVVADAAADPARVALELVAQAEHDPLACSVAFVVGEPLAQRIEAELRRLAPAAGRAAVVARSLAAAGGVLWCDTLEQAIEACNEWAPEHLLLAVADPERAFERVRAAGTVFLGASSSVAFGDYLTGANHVLPTGRAARFASGLSVLDFVRWTTFQSVSPAAAARLAAPVGVMADAEGLPGHAAAARAWGETP